jgi:hypothetical protein
VNDETIETEVENIDGYPEGDDVDAEDVSDADPETFEEKCRPFVNYSGGPRRTGSIWNSPLGLVATFFLASKVIDLAHRVIIEKQKSKRSEG